MHRVTKLLPGLSVALGLAMAAMPAVAQPRPATPSTTSALPNDVTLRLSGSSTVGGPLIVELATAWAKKLGLPGVRVDSGLDPDEYDVIAERAESARKLRVQVRAKGTGTGLEPLLRGQADIWMASRPVRESDIEAMRRRNVPNVPTLAQLQQAGTENVIGLDALAVVVHPRNPLKLLSMTQIKDIYSGRIANWSQVGGPNLPIAIYSPEPNFGTADTFCATIMGVSDIARCVEAFPRLAAPRFAVLEELSDAVAANPAGIGFTSLSLRRSTRAVQLGTECGVGIEADTFRIKTDEYPLGRRLFMYVAPGRAPNPATREFLQYILSAEGQAAVSASGFADLAPGKASDTYGADRLDNVRNAQDGGRQRIRPTDVRAFEEAIGSADRLSITFRFQAGTNNLDARAEADLVRLADHMKLPGFEKQQVVLVGFSGAAGDYAENRTLSRERAEAVRDRLVTNYGIKDSVALGVGPAAAVACNLDPNTAPLNQRVEVWLRKPAGG